MFDIPDKAEALMARLEAALPVRARPTPEVLKTLRQQSPKPRLPRHCDITEIYYAGDEGGILCTLDFGLDDSKQVYVVSITYLRLMATRRCRALSWRISGTGSRNSKNLTAGPSEPQAPFAPRPGPAQTPLDPRTANPPRPARLKPHPV